MEAIEFRYTFKDNKYGTAKDVRVIKNADDEGLRADEICEMFLDFMETAGFSSKNVLNYFQEEE